MPVFWDEVPTFLFCSRNIISVCVIILMTTNAAHIVFVKGFIFLSWWYPVLRLHQSIWNLAPRADTEYKVCVHKWACPFILVPPEVANIAWWAEFHTARFAHISSSSICFFLNKMVFNGQSKFSSQCLWCKGSNLMQFCLDPDCSYSAIYKHIIMIVYPDCCYI